MSTNKSNKHIEEYLKFYCKKENVTPFAVLLKGKWGCGKTFFIKNYIKFQKEKNLKIHFLHISLYGLSNIVEIKEKIAIELLPFMPTGYKKIIGKIFKTAKDTPITKRALPANLSDWMIYGFSRLGGDKIVIFDDLERCDIKIDRLLGYINHLVEFQEQKVIIIANEEEISEKDEYRKIKEKLIGKEFSVNSNPSEAINIFVDRIKNNVPKENKEIIKKENRKIIKKLLLQIFKESKHDNLRLMEQALSSFYYFYEFAHVQIEDFPDVFERVFYEFTIIFIEYKRGKIKSEDFLNKDFFGNLEVDESGKIVRKGHPSYLNKYKEMDNLIYFDFEILGKILQGISLTQKEEKLLVQKIEDVNVSQESWQKLWNYRENEDSDFFKNLEDVQNKWRKREYDDLFVVIHIIGIFLYFSKNGFLEKESSEILKDGKDYIDFLIKIKKFPNIKEGKYFRWKSGYYELGYHGNNLPEWKELLEYIDKKADELKSQFIKEKIKNELIPILKGEKEYSQSLELLINYNFLHDSSGQGEAYFSYFDVNEMKDIIVNREYAFVIYLEEIFEKRYTERKENINNIEDEYVFLDKLKKLLQNEIEIIEKKYRKQTPKSFLLKSFIKNALNPFIPNK